MVLAYKKLAYVLEQHKLALESEGYKPERLELYFVALAAENPKNILGNKVHKYWKAEFRRNIHIRKLHHEKNNSQSEQKLLE